MGERKESKRDHPLRVAVLLSGSGTSLENLLEHIDAGQVDAEVVVVVSSKEKAAGLERARRRGIPAVAVPRRQHPDAKEFNDRIHAVLAPYDVELVALLGFLSLFELRGRYEGRTINVHPALIPAFCGKGFYGHRVHEEVLASGVKLTGATVHLSDDAYDRGPILLQEAVPVLEDDTVETLAARVQAAERRLVPRAVQLFAEGRIRVEGRRARILPEVA
jgi:formyltetrahydrofolate-dependent phosphoribosylglycinamide formyltransferase